MHRECSGGTAIGSVIIFLSSIMFCNPGIHGRFTIPLQAGCCGVNGTEDWIPFNETYTLPGISTSTQASVRA